MHCAKGKKTNVKKSVYIRPLTKEMYDFLVYLVKNDGNCDIAVKERKPFKKNATVKFWRKRQSGEGFVLGKSSHLVDKAPVPNNRYLVLPHQKNSCNCCTVNNHYNLTIDFSCSQSRQN